MKRILTKDSCLGFIVKDYEQNVQCCYGRNERAAKLAYCNGVGHSNFEVTRREAITPVNDKPNVIKQM